MIGENSNEKFSNFLSGEARVGGAFITELSADLADSQSESSEQSEEHNSSKS